ncbi:peroxiredoxin-like family protein [Thiohalorhabdus sp.]|uniref:peroxiredoxin-like family protein n=1 Tax=Thiohalorhabdus sp. TaxID=3094134 RepID=UPI002FC397DC
MSLAAVTLPTDRGTIMQRSVLWVLGLFLLGPFPAAAEGPQLPDLSDRIEAFQEQRAAEGDSKLSPADRKALDRAMAQVRAELPDPGLAVGDEAPEFTLPNAFGEPVSLADQLAQGPVVLTFYRGAWCPYCNLELKALQESLSAFRDHGASVLAVSPQKPGKSLEQVREDGFSFEILSDLDNRVMKGYRLFFRVPEGMVRVYREKLGLDLADYNGDGRYVLPVPATFVIDREGVIRAAFAKVDYNKRMEPAAILEALRQLPKP